jgi:hypothetical protein
MTILYYVYWVNTETYVMHSCFAGSAPKQIFKHIPKVRLLHLFWTIILYKLYTDTDLRLGYLQVHMTLVILLRYINCPLCIPLR